MDEKDEKIRELETELEKTKKDLSETKEQLIEVLLSERRKEKTPEREEMEETQEKPILTFIGDSNSGRLLEDLKSAMNDHEITRTATMTTTDALEWSEAQPGENIDGMKILIHTGTNDIRHGSNAKQMYKNMKETIQNLEEKGAVVWIIQIPPMFTTEKDNKEVIKYNAMLEGTNDHQLITNEIINNDRDMMERDGYHLNKRGTSTWARHIAEKINKNTNENERTVEATPTNINIRIQNPTTTPKDTPAVESIETSAEIAGKVIGHQATTINTIKKKHQVKIQTITNGNKRTFRIEGNKQNVQNARQDISRIISETYNRDKRHEQTRPRSGYSAVCRYFRRGYCNKGRNCPFIHNAEYPVDISPRTPHREQTNRPNWPSTSQNPSYRDEEWPVPSNQPERKRKRSGESEEDLVHKLLAVMKEHKK